MHGSLNVEFTRLRHVVKAKKDKAFILLKHSRFLTATRSVPSTFTYGISQMSAVQSELSTLRYDTKYVSSLTRAQAVL